MSGTVPTMTTIIIRQPSDNDDGHQTKMVTLAALPGIANYWRTTCDCGWTDRTHNERLARSNANHHNTTCHASKAALLVIPRKDHP